MSDTALKLRVQRPRRSGGDAGGRPTGDGSMATAELELVSTQMLKVILSSRDDTERKAIERAANTSTDGVLARDPANGAFEIIEDDELQTILDANQGLPKLSRPADVTVRPLNDYAEEEQLSLVSTRALQRVLSEDDDEEQDDPGAEKDADRFDPYHSA